MTTESQDFDEFQGETMRPFVTPMPESKVVKPQGTQLTTLQTGVVALESLSEQLAFAERLIKEEMVSSTFKTPQQVVIGIQYAKVMKMEPIAALKMMYVVGNKPCLYSEGPLLLCQRSSVFDKIEEFFIDDDGLRISFDNKNLKSKVFGAVTRVWRKGDPLVQEDFFTLDDLKRAKLDVSKYGKKDVWEKWERLMLRYKARSMALKSKFADLIGGIGISEYDENFSPELPTITVEKTSSLNDTFGKKE